MAPADAFPTLYSPAELGGHTLKNRFVVSPMTRASGTPDGLATAQMADYYADYARGGWGLVIAEGTYPDEAHSQGYGNQPGIANDAQCDSWRAVTDAVHAAGAPIVMQLMHAGALSQHNIWRDETIGPSAVQPVGEQSPRYNGHGPYPVPREMADAEIADTIGGFAAAARRAIEAGFDGVEVHGANGYLPDQFLTAETNQRTDGWGGDIGARMRFHLEAVRAVRDAVPADKIVGVRMSQTKVNNLAYEWPGGEADAEAVFGALGDIANVFIHISSPHGCGPVFGADVSLAGLAKRYSGAQVIANGGLNDPAEAERVLTGGEAEFAAVARGALGDPAMPNKIAAGEAPVSFDPGMLSPNSTLDHMAAWRAENL